MHFKGGEKAHSDRHLDTQEPSSPTKSSDATRPASACDGSESTHVSSETLDCSAAAQKGAEEVAVGWRTSVPVDVKV